MSYWTVFKSNLPLNRNYLNWSQAQHLYKKITYLTGLGERPKELMPMNINNMTAT